MHRAALVAVSLTAAGCGRCGDARPASRDASHASTADGSARPGSPAFADGGPGDAAATVAASDAQAGAGGRSSPGLAFVTGTVVAAAEVDGRVRPLRLDVAHGSWQVLGGGDAHLFPSENADGDAILAIATRGDHQDDHVEQLAWVRGTAIEPFGPRAGAIRHPAHARGVLVVESSEHGFRDLYRIDSGGRAARLTDDAAGNFDPALSPDGATVVFASSRDGDSELYRMSSRGGRATRLTASAKDDWGARWSPDGRRLVFLSDREGAPRAFVMDADGTDLRRLTTETDPGVVEDTPRWSPDGQSIALVKARGAAGGVALVDVRRRTARSLTPDGAADREPVWSPDGSHLLVARRAAAGAPARVTFVRIPDGHAVTLDGAADPSDPLALRWYPAAAAVSPAAGSPGAATRD